MRSPDAILTLLLALPAVGVPVWLLVGGHVETPAALGAGALLAASALITWRRLAGHLSANQGGRPGDGAVAKRLGDAESRVDLLEALLAQFPDAVLLIDVNRQVVALNAAAEDQFGRAGIGADLARTFRVPALLEGASQLLAGPEGEAAAVLDVDCHIGGPEPRDLAARLVRMPAAYRDRVALLLVMHDLTTGSRVERMRAEFVSNVSHELRSPLASLVGFIETLKGPARDDAAARDRFLTIMATEADRMTRLINDLLSLSRVEADEYVRPKEPVDLIGVIQATLGSLALRAEERGVALVFHAPETPLPPLLGDEDQLAQVFQNLLDNALKYGRDGTEVQISVSMLARIPEQGLAGVEVAIRDQGDGIPAEHLHRLTERFYRVDKGRSRSMGGTGLGLAIVKHVLNRHRGVLRIQSEEGKGSVFRVYLPAAAPVQPD